MPPMTMATMTFQDIELELALALEAGLEVVEMAVWPGIVLAVPVWVAPVVRTPPPAPSVMRSLAEAADITSFAPVVVWSTKMSKEFGPQPRE